MIGSEMIALKYDFPNIPSFQLSIIPVYFLSPLYMNFHFLQQAAAPYSRSWSFPTFKYHFKSPWHGGPICCASSFVFKEKGYLVEKFCHYLAKYFFAPLEIVLYKAFTEEFYLFNFLNPFWFRLDRVVDRPISPKAMAEVFEFLCPMIDRDIVCKKCRDKSKCKKDGAR
jgi:hypothetical protein